MFPVTADGWPSLPAKGEGPVKSRRRTTRIEPLEPRLLMAVHTVLNNDDSGVGSLRQAIAEAANGDTIDLASLTGTVRLQSALSINKTLSLAGPGETNLTITATSGVRAIEVAPGATLNIADICIASARSGAVGGAIRSDGTLTLTRVTFANNVGVGSGGAIYQERGTLLINNCTFANNTVTATSIDCMGGAITASGAYVSITSSTFVGNSADGGTGALVTPAPSAYGGALRVYLAPRLTIANSTFTNNSALGAAHANTPSQSGLAFGGAMQLEEIMDGFIANCTIAPTARWMALAA
jgi:hypothetical protein